MSTSAGYSGTPLPAKLGIRPGYLVALVGAPPGFRDLLGDLPGVELLDELPGTGVPLDVIVFFTTSRAEYEVELGPLRAGMAPACGLWIAWPKRAARVPTDMTEHVVREVALPTGLVDNKVCAIDQAWTGLRLVIRRELR
ncbi:MAG: hypothetical protein ACLPKI_00795 [Streptosporangiaceae bacterium]